MNQKVHFALHGGVTCLGGPGSSPAVPHPALAVGFNRTKMQPADTSNRKLALVLYLKAKRFLHCYHK